MYSTPATDCHQATLTWHKVTDLVLAMMVPLHYNLLTPSQCPRLRPGAQQHHTDPRIECFILKLVHVTRHFHFLFSRESVRPPSRVESGFH